MLDKEKSRSWDIFNRLVMIGCKYTSSPQISAVCAAFALYLAHNCKGETDLTKILDKNDVPKNIQGYVMLLIGDHWNEYLPLLTVFKDDELADLFATSRWVESLGYKFGCFTSISVNRLAIALLDPKESDRVCDLGCGMGDFLRDVYFYAGGIERCDEERFVGYEISSDFASIASMRMKVDDIRANVVQGDFFAVGCLKEHFDKVFCCPPFGVRDLGARIDVQEAIRSAFPDFPEIRRSASSDWLYAARAASAITEDGKAVVIMTAGAMANLQSGDYRRYFVQRGLIEAVIELPERLFAFTGVSTYAVILSKGNSRVKMLRASSICDTGMRMQKLSHGNVASIVKSLHDVENMNDSTGLNNVTIVPKDKLLSGGCELNVGRFFADPITVKNPAPLSSYLSSIKRGTVVPANELSELKCEEATDVRCVSSRDIHDGVIDEGACHLRSLPSAYTADCAHDGDILIPRVVTKGAALNVAVVSAGPEQAVLPTGNLLVLSPNPEKADPYFLKAYLETEYAQRVLQNGVTGNAISNLPSRTLEQLEIPKLSLPQQRKIGAQCRKMVERVMADKKRLAESQAKLASVFADNASDCFVANKEHA